jgi:hypothetical protein
VGKCGAAGDRMRVCDVVGSTVQVYREHADLRAARVARQPVQSRPSVRPPGSTCARGLGTCAPGARWSRRGCGWMRCGTRSDARTRCRGFGRSGRSRTRRSPRCPSRSAACPILSLCVCAGHLARVAAALGRRRTLKSAGKWLDAVRHAIGCACATSWALPCRNIENTPIAGLPESFGSLSKLVYLCVRRALARVALARPVLAGVLRGIGWMLCSTRSDARVRRLGFGRAGGS